MSLVSSRAKKTLPLIHTPDGGLCGGENTAAHHTAKLHPKEEKRLLRERQRAQGGKR